MSTIIRISVLSWSAALLTASYAGLLAKMDPTFIATVFTAAAATFGVDTLKKGDKDDEEKPDAYSEENSNSNDESGESEIDEEELMREFAKVKAEREQ